MNNLSLHNISSHIHAPNVHHANEVMQRLLHSERFWAAVALTAFIALLIGLALWIGPAGGEYRPIPTRPYSPYW